jgi:hypothetical protein
MSTRKEREKEFFVQHMDTFRTLKLTDHSLLSRLPSFRKVSMVDKFSSLNLKLVKERTFTLSSMTMSLMIKELLQM